MTEKKKDAVATNWVVEVFDDRVPVVAKCSKHIKVVKGTPDYKIASIALSEVYGSDEEWKAHCTRVHIYAADVTFRVVDGDKYKLVSYRDDKKVVRTADEIREYCARNKKPLIPASDQGVLFFAEQVVWIVDHLTPEENPDHAEMEPFANWLQGKGSGTIVTVEMPKDAAQKLLKGFNEQDPELLKAMEPFGGLRSVKLVDKREEDHEH